MNTLLHRTQVRTTLQGILSDLKASHKQYIDELQSCPPGSLRVYTSRDRVLYTQAMHHNGKWQRRGISKDKQLLRALARKEFLREVIGQFDHDIAVITDALTSFRGFDADAVLKVLKTRYPKLPGEYFYDPNWIPSPRTTDEGLNSRLQACREWAKQPYEKSTYKQWEKKVRTSRGLLVRTKSEALICEMLYNYGIPFRYEQVLHVEDGILVPDYTFRAADGSHFYWEHAGMLTKPKYSFRHHLKMLQYESEGIYPWQRLIVTYDIDNEIDLERIDSVIQNFLLPML